MQPLAISQECLYFHKKFGCIYALTSYFCPVYIVRCISSCHILFHFFKEGHWGVFSSVRNCVVLKSDSSLKYLIRIPKFLAVWLRVFFLFVLSPQAFGVNSIVLGDNSKAYGDNSKGYGDRIHPYKKV